MVKKYNPSWTFPEYDPDPFWMIDVPTGRWVARPPAERQRLDPRVVRHWGSPVTDVASSSSTSSSTGRAFTIPAQEATSSAAPKVQMPSYNGAIVNASPVIKSEHLSSGNPGKTPTNASTSFAHSMSKARSFSDGVVCRTNADNTSHGVPESTARAAEASATHQIDVEKFNEATTNNKKATSSMEPWRACASASGGVTTGGNSGTTVTVKQEEIRANLDGRGSMNDPGQGEIATMSEADASLDDSRIDPTCKACTTRRHVAHTCGRGLSRFRKRYAGFVPALHKAPSREEGVSVPASELAAAEEAQKLCKACTTRRHVAHTCGRQRPVGKKRKNALKALEQEGLYKEVAARTEISQSLQPPKKQFVCGACGTVFRTSHEILFHHAHQRCAAAEYSSGGAGVDDAKSACSDSAQAPTGSPNMAGPTHTEAVNDLHSTQSTEPMKCGRGDDLPLSKRMKASVPSVQGAEAVPSPPAIENDTKEVGEAANNADSPTLKRPKLSQGSEEGVVTTSHPAVPEPVPGSRAFGEPALADSHSTGGRTAAPLLLHPRLPEDESRPALPEEVKQIQMSAANFIAHVQRRFCETPSMYVRG